MQSHIVFGVWSAFWSLYLGLFVRANLSFPRTQIHTIVKKGIVLDRWARGLSVMLEKLFGCALITKLWLILLMEADFNATNKIVYGNRMLHKVRQSNLMPEEIYSEKNRLADDDTLVKVLF